MYDSIRIKGKSGWSIRLKLGAVFQELEINESRRDLFQQFLLL